MDHNIYVTIFHKFRKMYATDLFLCTPDTSHRAGLASLG